MRITGVLVLTIVVLLGVKCAGSSGSKKSPFDAMDMRSAMDFARAAYCEPAVLQTWSCGPACDAKPSFNAERVLNITNSRVTVFLGYEPGDRAIVISFRGTTTPMRWVNALRVAQMADHPDPSCGCRVHSAIYKEWEGLSYHVMKTMDELRHKYNDPRIIFTGHGIGGAFATLAGIDCATHYTRDFVVYTFGEPRIGDHRFVHFAEKALEGKRFRVTHGGDTVALLPPKSRDFQHFGQELWYASGKYPTYTTCAGQNGKPGQDDVCSFGHAYPVPAGDEDVKGIADHLVYGGSCMDCRCDKTTLARKHNAAVADLVMSSIGEQADPGRVGDL